MQRNWMTRSLSLVSLATVAVACSGGVDLEEGFTAAPVSSGTGGGTPDGTIDFGSGGASGGTSGQSPLLVDSTEEVCDNLDNDGDGFVDEDCPCSRGETQGCYPDTTGPAEGCGWGTQLCNGGHWGQSRCVGATSPPAGEAACCSVLADGQAEHPLFDAFVAAYPASTMPASHADVAAFDPVADGHRMVWAQANAGNEIVDRDRGGVTEAHVQQGREVSKQAVIDAMIPGGAVVVTREPAVHLEGTGCGNGIGWGWGSVLYENPDGSVVEAVYLYIGFCVGGRDIEAFFYSESPLEVCAPPEVLR